MFLEEDEIQQVIDALVDRLRSDKEVGRWTANSTSWDAVHQAGWEATEEDCHRWP